jgi:hypothetical protein
MIPPTLQRRGLRHLHRWCWSAGFGLCKLAALNFIVGSWKGEAVWHGLGIYCILLAIPAYSLRILLRRMHSVVCAGPYGCPGLSLAASVLNALALFMLCGSGLAVELSAIIDPSWTVNVGIGAWFWSMFVLFLAILATETAAYRMYDRDVYPMLEHQNSRIDPAMSYQKVR